MGHGGPAGDDLDRQLDRAPAQRLLLDAYSGSADVHTVVTAFVLAATGASGATLAVGWIPALLVLSEG